MNNEEMIEILQDKSHLLSAWEQNFLDSLVEQLDNDDDLTPRQEDKLRSIFRDAIPD